MYFYFKGLVFYSVFLTDVVYLIKGQCFNKSQNPDDMYCKAIHLECPQNYVIYKPDVRASSKSCETKETALEGVPVDLTADIAECFWKQSCLINFPKAPIFTDARMEDVQSIHIVGWDCIRNKEINHDKYFSTAICEGHDHVGTAKIDTGLFLSHHDTPWNYNRRSFPTNISGNPSMKCIKTLHMGYEQCILLTIDMLDIDHENDKLMIDNEEIIGVDLPKTFKFWTRTHIKNVPIVFTSKIGQSKSGSGFVICYTKCDTDNGQISACETLMKPKQHKARLAASSDVNCEKGVYQPQAEESNVCTKTETKPDQTSGKCKLNDKLIKKRCKNCKVGITKCRKKYRSTCPDCCPGVNILEKCKPIKSRNKKSRKNKDRSKSGTKTKRKAKGNVKERAKP